MLWWFRISDTENLCHLDCERQYALAGQKGVPETCIQEEI